MTTRAKFLCNEATIRMGSAPNPAYAELLEEVSASNPDANDLPGLARKAASERGIPEWISCKLPTVKLNPVYAPDDPNHENYKFWTASPSGELTMTIANPAGAEVFEVGRLYYVDFTPAD